MTRTVTESRLQPRERMGTESGVGDGGGKRDVGRGSHIQPFVEFPVSEFMPEPMFLTVSLFSPPQLVVLLIIHLMHFGLSAAFYYDYFVCKDLQCLLSLEKESE